MHVVCTMAKFQTQLCRKLYYPTWYVISASIVQVGSVPGGGGKRGATSSPHCRTDVVASTSHKIILSKCQTGLALWITPSLSVWFSPTVNAENYEVHIEKDGKRELLTCQLTDSLLPNDTFFSNWLKVVVPSKSLHTTNRIHESFLVPSLYLLP